MKNFIFTQHKISSTNNKKEKNTKGNKVPSKRYDTGKNFNLSMTKSNVIYNNHNLSERNLVYQKKESILTKKCPQNNTLHKKISLSSYLTKAKYSENKNYTKSKNKNEINENLSKNIKIPKLHLLSKSKLKSNENSHNSTLNNFNLQNEMENMENFFQTEQKDCNKSSKRSHNKNTLRNCRKKINYSIFINISKIDQQTNENDNSNNFSEESFLKKELFKIPVYSKKRPRLLYRSTSTIIKRKKNNYFYSIYEDSSVNNNVQKRPLYRNKSAITKIKKSKNNNNNSYRNTFMIESCYYENIEKIILLQSFIRKYLSRLHLFKRITKFYKYEAGLRHIKKYGELFLIKKGLSKRFFDRIKYVYRKKEVKKNKNNKTYFVNEEDFLLIKDLRKNNIRSIKDFKNYIVWCINNGIKEIK